MLADIKNTLKQSAIYGISRFAAKSVSFLLIPLYTSIFSSENIANINLLESLWQYIFTICLFSFETAIIAYCTTEKDQSKVQSILFTFFALLVINSVLLIIIGSFASNAVAANMLNDPGLSNSTFYCFIIACFESLLVIPLTIARLQSKPVFYTVISVLNLLINLLFQFYFLIIVKGNIDYIFLSKALAPAILVIVLIPYVLKNFKFQFQTKLLSGIYKFSFPLMAASLLALLLNTLNRYIIVDYATKTEVAIYTLGNSIGGVTNFFIVSPFVLAFSVISWKKLKDDNAERFFTKTATYLYFIMIYISLIVSLFIPEVIKIFVLNPELWSSVGIIRIILLSNCIAALYYVSIQSYYFTKRTDYIFWIFTFCLAFNIVTNLIFIRYYGIYASAILSVLSYILLIIISYLIAKKLYFIKFEHSKIILLSMLYIILSYLVYFLKLDYLLIYILIKLVIILVFPFMLYSLGFYERIEIESIKNISRKYIRINKGN